MEEKRQCCKCGFLAVRNVEDSHVYSADERLRANGVLPMRDFPGSREPHLGASLIRRSDTVLCYLGRVEMTCPPQTNNCIDAIRLNHECPRFVPWLPGKTPKEHEDMSILEQVRTEQAIFRLEESKNNRITRLLAVGSLIVSGLAAAAAMWTSFIQPPSAPIVNVAPSLPSIPAAP